MSPSVMIVPLLAIGLAVPAMAQQSSNMHYYMLRWEWNPRSKR